MKHSQERYYNYELILAMIHIYGGTVQAADAMGVGYNGSWAKWKRDPATVPAYIVRSMEAHSALRGYQRDRIEANRVMHRVEIWPTTHARTPVG